MSMKVFPYISEINDLSEQLIRQFARFSDWFDMATDYPPGFDHNCPEWDDDCIDEAARQDFEELEPVFEDYRTAIETVWVLRHLVPDLESGEYTVGIYDKGNEAKNGYRFAYQILLGERVVYQDSTYSKERSLALASGEKELKRHVFNHVVDQIVRLRENDEQI